MKTIGNEHSNWILKFLRWFCPNHLLEEIEGDLIQKFEKDVKSFGERKAKRRLLWNTIRFFRPGILLRNNPSIELTPFYMLSNYFKVALRVMFRNKTFSAISVSGLTLGITGALLLFLWIKHEFSYDQFHVDKDNLYMAWNRATENGQINCWPTTPRVLAPTLEKEFASVEKAVSYADWGSTHLFTVGEKRLLKTSGIFTDPAFLSMFSFPLIKGDSKNALEGPKAIVLTEDFARQLFGDKEPLGESITIGQDGYNFEFTVTGILKDLPANTSFKFEYLISFQFLESLGEKDTFWGNNSVATLVKLKDGSDLLSVNDQIKDIEKKNYADGQHIEIFLHPMTQMHLYSRFENGVVAGGRIEVMRLLAMLGVCLVVIACINFINLSTARAQRRAKEVAIRKVTGAHRYSLVMQFICESVLIAFSAGLIAIFSVYFLLPVFNSLIDQRLSLDFENITVWLWIFGLIITVGLLAGSYPALFLSSFRPVAILKGVSLNPGSRHILRTLLVVFQFGFAVTLIVSSIVIRKQINYVQNRDAGYSRDHLIYMPLTGDLNKNFMAFRNEIMQETIASSITKTSAPITEQWSSTGGIHWRGKNPEDRTDFERIYVDENFVTTSGLTLLQGRDMNLQQFPTDSTAALVNETALKIMGFDTPIGEVIQDNGRDWHVIGVVKDFVFTSPYQKVEPIVLFGGKPKWAFNVIYLKLNPDKPIRENLSSLANLSNKYNPDYPFEYHFADIAYQQKFDDMQTTLKISTLFTSIAIFIACLGLLGLTTFMTEARVKEIGIRKVMGGTVLGITRLLSFAALKPILIAIVLFTPLAWLSINWWLQSFAYSVSLDVWIFLYAAFSLLLIALLTIGTQTIRAAKANPVNSLRSE